MRRLEEICVVSPLVLLFASLPVMAGALAPCVKAVSSANGNFLVVSEAEQQPGDSANVHQVILEVFPKETFINEKDKVTSPNKYWENWQQWSVVLNSANAKPFLSACPLALVTDDGEFVILLNRDVVDGNPALRIYHRRDHLGEAVRKGPDHDVLVRDISLNQIWPATKLSDVQLFTDESPQWFAGGTFEFSADSRVLVHKTRYGTTVRINLNDGSVSIEHGG